jgi:anaerobic ribonucleoside-triphosphate reductase activating protein
MLRLYNYNIVFQEVPDETTLAINLANCPNRCKGCHSPHLMEDIGEPLNQKSIEKLIDRYGAAITCICFMGGDASPLEISRLAAFIRQTAPSLKTAWYSGRPQLPDPNMLIHFDYIKTGPYIQSLGPLNSPKTNQRFYRIEAGGAPVDITRRFWEAAAVALHQK